MGAARERAVEAAEAPLSLVPWSIASRLVVGIGLGVAWSRVAVEPLLSAIETDVPVAMRVVLTLLAVAAPAALFLRRHALPASVRWDATGVTHLVGGHVATAIRWEDATIAQRLERGARVVRIVDARGRCIWLAARGRLFAVRSRALEGRCQIDASALEALLDAARGRARAVPLPLHEADGAGRRFAIALLAVASCALCLWLDPLSTAWFAGACLLVLRGPLDRVVATIRRPHALEALLIDTEERGRIRARRLDGTAVLLDVSAASHPDAMLATRRGFVNAVLEIPRRGGAPSYRATETPIPATYVETRDDRVLRFETLRAALVDVVGYGAFFVTSVAALVVGA